MNCLKGDRDRWLCPNVSFVSEEGILWFPRKTIKKLTDEGIMRRQQKVLGWQRLQRLDVHDGLVRHEDGIQANYKKKYPVMVIKPKLLGLLFLYLIWWQEVRREWEGTPLDVHLTLMPHFYPSHPKKQFLFLSLFFSLFLVLLIRDHHHLRKEIKGTSVKVFYLRLFVTQSKTWTNTDRDDCHHHRVQ